MAGHGLSTDKIVQQAKEFIKKDKLATAAASETVPYGKILNTYADRTDKVLMTLGYFFSIVTGLGLPSFTFLFGDIVVSFTGGGSMTDTVNKLAL